MNAYWSSPLNTKLMELLNNTKQDLSPRDILQTYRIDYMKKFSPMTKINIIHIILSLVVNFDRLIH